MTSVYRPDGVPVRPQGGRRDNLDHSGILDAGTVTNSETGAPISLRGLDVIQRQAIWETGGTPSKHGSGLLPFWNLNET